MEEALNNEVDKTIWPANIRQILLVASLVLAWWAHKPSGHGSKDEGDTWVNVNTHLQGQFSYICL